MKVKFPNTARRIKTAPGPSHCDFNWPDADKQLPYSYTLLIRSAYEVTELPFIYGVARKAGLSV